jgi:hypothetical protein
MSRPNTHDDPEPSTYFEIEQNRLVNPGEEKTAPTMPTLPASSPWHHDPVPPEPTIDRSIEDGPTINIHGDQS